MPGSKEITGPTEEKIGSRWKSVTADATNRRTRAKQPVKYRRFAERRRNPNRTISDTAPSLTIRLTPTNTVAVSWPSPSTGWRLQQNTNSVASVTWSNTPGLIQDDGAAKTLLINPPAENRFYRLFKP